MASIRHSWNSLGPWTKFKWIAVFLLCVLTLILFIENVKRYYFLSDDCYISFRYALNLYNGHGLVWNPGERVEGYTNFLWVIIMTLGMVVKIPPEILSNVIGIASGVVVLASLAYFSAKHAGWDNPIIFLAPLLLSTSRSFTGWCTGGLATMFFTMLLFLAFLLFLKERDKEVTYPFGSSILFATSALTRPDALLFILTAGIFFTAEVLAKRRTFASLVTWSSPLLLIVGAHFIWRYSYYGYWLPNTFYAKVSGFWGEQAYLYLSLFQKDYKIFFFLPLILLPAIANRKFVYNLFLGVIIAYLSYIIYIGGDRFEFRFLVYLFPYLYWLLSEGIRVLIVLQYKGKWPRIVSYVITFAIIGALLVTTHLGSIKKEAKKTRHNVASIQEIKSYANFRATEGKFLRSLIDRGLLPDDIILCVGGAGALPYYTQWPTVDLVGMNDTTIAHTPIQHRGMVGHEKGGTVSYLRIRKVELLDFYNRIVHKKPVENQLCDDNRGCVKSIKVGNYYLNFVTFLPDRDFERRFGKLLKAQR